MKQRWAPQRGFRVWGFPCPSSYGGLLGVSKKLAAMLFFFLGRGGGGGGGGVSIAARISSGFCSVVGSTNIALSEA